MVHAIHVKRQTLMVHAIHAKKVHLTRVVAHAHGGILVATSPVPGTPLPAGSATQRAMVAT
jgi:hypothetical protein